jgi:hypothetical protein
MNSNLKYPRTLNVSYVVSLWLVGWLVGWLVDLLVYSCSSHLERRTSVKRFVSLQFLNLRHSVGLLGRVVSPSEGRYLTQTQNKHRQASMPRVRFEPTIPGFERAKIVHALDRAATVIGCFFFVMLLIYVTTISILKR